MPGHESIVWAHWSSIGTEIGKHCHSSISNSSNPRAYTYVVVLIVSKARQQGAVQVVCSGQTALCEQLGGCADRVDLPVPTVRPDDTIDRKSGYKEQLGHAVPHVCGGRREGERELRHATWSYESPQMSLAAIRRPASGRFAVGTGSRGVVRSLHRHGGTATDDRTRVHVDPQTSAKGALGL